MAAALHRTAALSLFSQQLVRLAASSSTRSFALPTLAVTLRLSIPPIVSDIWDSILKAVPKKKQSHSRKRMRQLAGKALPDIVALNECPGCGFQKRSHHLCPTCVNEIRQMWKAGVGIGETVVPESQVVGDK